MATPLISVIVPIYNIKEYLPRCVDSIVHQTYRNLEILLVDDGSNDGTAQLCDSLAKTDERICVFHKKNGGSSSARNLGLQKAHGDYVAFVDSDDYIDIHMYERLMYGIQHWNADIAQVGRDEVEEDGSKRPDICVPPQKDEFVSSKDFMKESCYCIKGIVLFVQN